MGYGGIERVRGVGILLLLDVSSGGIEVLRRWIERVFINIEGVLRY